jgi:hypothetical protein
MTQDHTHRRLVVGLALVVGLVAFGANRADASVPTNKGTVGAGYLSQPANGITSTSTTFVVPTVNCTNAPSYATIDIGLTIAPEFGSTGHSFSGMHVFCGSPTNPIYQGSLKVASSPVIGTDTHVQPGDRLDASFKRNGSYLVGRLKDERTGSVMQISENSTSPDVLVGAAAKTAIPNFGTVQMGKTMVNGVAIGSTSPLTHEVLQLNKDVQVSSTILNSTGKGFKVVWRAAT